MTEIGISQIQEHNSWWRRPEFILENPFLSELKGQKFVYYHPLYYNFSTKKDAILTLRGPRRVGKTTLLMLIIKKLLLEEKVNPENVMFFPADILENYTDLHELLDIYLNFIRPRTKKRVFIFLDEISFVKEWPRAVKSLVDAGKFENAALLITGSNVLDLKFSSERMPGRRGKVFPWDIKLLPLNFAEYISLIKPSVSPKSLMKGVGNLPEYQKLFDDYLLTGGFPVSINEYYRKKYLPPELYEIFLSWIEGDLHKIGKSEDVAYRIFERLLVHLTTPISYHKLAKESGLTAHGTVEEYLDILEKMFVLKRLNYFSLAEKKVFYRKNRKIYFLDPFIYNAISAKVHGFLHQPFTYSKEQILTPAHKPALVENTTALSLVEKYAKLYFGQSVGHEIDFVGFHEGKYEYFEVKYQKRVERYEFDWTKKLIGKAPLFVLTQKAFSENNFTLVPAEVFLSSAKSVFSKINPNPNSNFLSRAAAPTSSPTPSAAGETAATARRIMGRGS